MQLLFPFFCNRATMKQIKPYERVIALKIAMIGSGAAGSVFAAYLKRGGADLYLVDRYEAHMKQVRENGLLLREGEKETLLTGFHTTDSAKKLETMDVVILMVKCTQTKSVMPEVMHCIGEHTVVVSLQNGLDNHEILSEFVPDDRLILGFGKIGTELPAPAVCVARPEPGTAMYFGAVKKSELTDAVGKQLEAYFLAGGCQAEFVEDIRPYIWRKGISNCGYNTVCAVLGLPVGAVLRNEQGRELIRQVWTECCDVAEALGIGRFHEEMDAEEQKLLEGFSEYYPSMAQDVIKQRQTEIMHMNGVISRYGRELGVPTNANNVLTTQICTIQSNYPAKR